MSSRKAWVGSGVGVRLEQQEGLGRVRGRVRGRGRLEQQEGLGRVRGRVRVRVRLEQQEGLG